MWLGADLAMKQNQPDRALKLLESYDQAVKAMPGAADLLLEGDRIRVPAYLGTNQLDKAVALVQKLAAANPNETAPFVQQVLNRLDKDFAVAQQAQKKDEMAAISAGQASLTKYLVEWAASSKDEKVKADLPKYKLYEANQTRRAGSLQVDEAKKKQILKEAVASYEAVRRDMDAQLRELAQKKMTAEARKTASAGIQGAMNSATLGIGLCQYDLGDYNAARDALGTLIAGGKLGSEKSPVVEAGETRYVDNNTYWEAMYKWLDCRLKTAKPGTKDGDAEIAATRDTLRNVYINNGLAAGGDFAPQLAELRKTALGAWVPGNTAPAPAATPAVSPGAPPAPATQPVAAGK